MSEKQITSRVWVRLQWWERFFVINFWPVICGVLTVLIVLIDLVEAEPRWLYMLSGTVLFVASNVVLFAIGYRAKESIERAYLEPEGLLEFRVISEDKATGVQVTRRYQKKDGKLYELEPEHRVKSDPDQYAEGSVEAGYGVDSDE